MISARSSSAQSEEKEITLADGTVIRGGRVTGTTSVSREAANSYHQSTTHQVGAPMVASHQTYQTSTTPYQGGAQVTTNTYASGSLATGQYQQSPATGHYQTQGESMMTGQYQHQSPATGQYQHQSPATGYQQTQVSQYQQRFGTPTQTATSYQVGEQMMHQGQSIHMGQSTQMSSTITRQDMQAREISVHTLTGNEVIIGERIVEHEVKVPKRIVREEIIEKVIVVPEKIVHEEVIEETQRVREKVIEVARPIYQEKIIEVPEIEYVEKIVEYAERVVQEKIREVPRVEIQERIIEVPRIVHQEKVVEVPEIEYREIPIEKIVEVPQIQEEVIVREVMVPQYVDKPIAEHVTVEVPQKIERNIPIPVEAVTTFEYRLPHIRPHYKKATFPVYVPRFVEVPVPEELVAGAVGAQAAHLAKHVELLTTQAAPSLCEIENIAADIKKMDLASHIASSDYHSTIQQAWARGNLNISPADGEMLHRGIPSQMSGQVTTQVTNNTSGNFVPVVYTTASQASERKSKNTREKSDKKHRSTRTGQRVR